jgi:long-chain acyl-CoA synthetase
VSQVLVVGDGRPYVACLITLDEESVEVWKTKFPDLQNASMAELAKSPELLAELQGAVDDANKAVSRAEAVRRFHVLPGDFTEQSGHLTPSLKVRRNVIMKDYAGEVEALYS